MARTLEETPITTRSARERLKPGTYFRALDINTHLGYRKRKAGVGGEWFVRWRAGKGYLQATLGAADDVLDADGTLTLDFQQAGARARDHVEAARLTAAAAAAGPIETVRSTVDAYIAGRTEREETAKNGKGAKRDAKSRLGRHVLKDVVANIELHKLTEDDLRGWRDRVDTKGLAVSTTQRLVNDFRAALNGAALKHRKKLPPAFPIVVRDGFKSTTPVQTVAREGQILPDSDIVNLVAAALEIDAEGQHDGDLSRIITVMASTGARFSQIIRMRIADVQPAQSRLMIPVSAKGRGVKRQTHIAVPVGADVIAALRPAMVGRRGPEPLLLRWCWKQVDKIKWVRDVRAPWKTSSELNRYWKEIVKRAGLPSDTIMYAFRHSSIVRGLRGNLPVRLVAALHDTSSEMIEAHYAAYIVDGLSELAAKAVISVVPVPAGDNVVPITSQRS